MEELQRMVRVRQNLPAYEVDDIRQEVLRVLKRLNTNGMELGGSTVGITAGSRGIHAIPEILQTVVDFIKEAKGHPVLIPSMGTHGGFTADRQIAFLNSLGITEEAVGAPILACIDTVLLGETGSGVPVYCNTEATKVDRIVVLNRIKPHTDFSGEIESGITKMMAIGLGSHQGAFTTHSHALLKGYEKVFIDVASLMLEKLPVAFALGILENWKGKTAEMDTMLPDEIFEKERQLLKKAKSNTMKLPFETLDVLVIGEIGKNISGTGMDTKVVGRIMVKGQKEPESPKITRLVVLGLTPESHGNAIGIGLADITTQRTFEQVDLYATADNSISSMSPEQGRLPCVVRNDREALQSAIVSLGAVNPSEAQMVYIDNTMQLEVMAVSESLIDRVRGDDRLELIGSPEELQFDEQGNLLNFRGSLS